MKWVLAAVYWARWKILFVYIWVFQDNQMVYDMYPLHDNNIHNLKFTDKFRPKFVIVIMVT